MADVPKVGDRASEFELPDSTGRMRTLEELLGNGKVALIFFRGLW